MTEAVLKEEPDVTWAHRYCFTIVWI